MRRVVPAAGWPESWELSYHYDRLELYGESPRSGYVYAYDSRRRTTLDLVRRAVAPGATVLDVAAAQGNFTLALALISVIMTQVIGVRAQGRGYWSKYFNTRRMFKVPFFGAMDFLVGLLEIISELSKILSFTFRLFGNMFAGVVLVAIVVSLLGFITIVPAMLMLFELFVGLIQAFVFGMLTMVFMAQATQGHGEEHAEAH
jgi:F0F1-type ATP synthase membrane subunit a